VGMREVCVLNEQGLHARPAARLAQEAQKFDCRVCLMMGDQEVDAKSILDILSLAAGKGCGLEVKAEGVDAEKAVDRLAALFKSRFNEEK